MAITEMMYLNPSGYSEKIVASEKTTLQEVDAGMVVVIGEHAVLYPWGRILEVRSTLD